jgi:predicted nucleic acid-binding Zn ribbon protein/regulation of enolase protein 1 (concanavalin A-like superfamily)
MTNKLVPFTLVVLLCTAFTTVQAQSRFWQSISEKEVPENETRKIFPQRYALYQLNDSEFKNWLEQAPAEEDTNVRDSDHILTIPTPDGGTQSFRIVSYTMMEAALAEQFPEISNYYGIGVRNPAQQIRLDWTYRGFHAMIMGGGEDTYYIDPFQWDDTQHYQVYFKKDYARPEGNEFKCGVKGTAEATDGNGSNRMAGDCTFRTYRLAMATTGEYSNFHGATSAAQSNLVLSAVNTAMSRVNGIYERDIAVRMILIGNTADIFYYDGSTDPYTNNDGFTMLFENQTNIDAIIGTANYDIGHVFSTGGGGIASLNSPCTSFKARGVTGLPNPIGDPFYVDYVAHEMGHQFGANHTQNNSCQRVLATAMEPGSASTIMGYAGICAPNVQNNSDDYFHAISIQEMTANITIGNSSTCDMESQQGNAPPAVTLASTSYNIPNGTPFVLTASSSDLDGTGSHTFCWEQYDNEVAAMPPQSTNTGGPAFRTFDPTPSPSRYFPNLADVPAGNTWEVLPTVARTMDFRVTVRDNAAAQGCTDEADVTLTVDGTAGPFNVTAPAAAASWTGSSFQMVNWDVAGTDQAPINCSQVDIFLSTDGGLTYPTPLAIGVSNVGFATVNVPNNITTTTARIMVKAANNVFFDLNAGNFSISASSVAPGDIIITEIMQNPDVISDSNGEWFEVYNTTNATIDLNGWRISDAGSDNHVINGTVNVPANGYALLMRNGNSATNGGLTADYVYGTSISLANGDDEIILSSSTNVEIDRVEYDGGPNWPDPTGASMSLNPSAFTATANDDFNNWCEASSAYEANNAGTPGAANDACCAAPTAVCTNVTVQLDANGNGSTTTAAIGSGSTAPCGLQSETLSQSTFTCADVPSVMITYTITDINGDSDNCQATVTVVDNAAPTAVCQDITVNIEASNTVSIAAADVDGGSSTACGSYTPSIPATSFGCADVGNTVGVTLTVTDDSNSQTDQCTANVTVTDPNNFCCAAPTAVCTNVTVQLDANGNGSTTTAAIGSGSTASCGLQSEMLSQSAFTCADVPSVMVTYTITDLNGDSDNCQATVTVVDNAAPTAVCQDITVNIEASNTVSIAAADVDGGSSTACGSYTPSIPATSFGCADVGNTVGVTLTVTDDSNSQTDQCTANVTVTDPNNFCCAAPTAVCTNVTVQLDANGNGSTTTAAIGSGSTATCGLQSETLSQSAFTCADVPSVMVTYTITDLNGDSDNCQATVTVEDNTAPTAVCQDITVSLPASGTASISATDVDGGSSTACGSYTPSIPATSFGCADVGNTVAVTLTVTDDSNGLTDQCTANVTIEDNTAPTAVCQDITVDINASGTASIVAADVDGGSSTTCGTYTPSIPTTSFDCTDVGTTVGVTLTVTDDSNGQTNQCTANVTVVDNTTPTAVCQDITVDITSSNTVSIAATDIDGGSFATCGTYTPSIPATTFDCSDVGNTIGVMLTVTDDSNGQTDQCTANVTVADPNSFCCTAPTAVCENVTVELDENGMGSLMPAEVGGNSIADCGIQSESLSQSTFDCSNLGTTTAVTYTITDVNGDSDNCTASVTVAIGQGLPGNWQEYEIGSNPQGSSFTADPCSNNGEFTITGSGNNGFPPTADAVAFAGQNVCGDFMITTKIESITPNGYGGLMVRENTSPGAKQFSLFSNLTNVLLTEIRTATNAPKQQQLHARPFPFWIRIQRMGPWMLAYYSPNGVNFQYVQAAFVPMNACVEVGLATFTSTGPSTTAVFSNVSIMGGFSALQEGDVLRDIQQQDLQQTQVFPNPTRDLFTLSFPDGLEEAAVARLRNQGGQMVEQRQLRPGDAQTEWSLSKLPAGMYFLEVQIGQAAPQVLRVIKAE